MEYILEDDGPGYRKVDFSDHFSHECRFTETVSTGDGTHVWFSKYSDANSAICLTQENVRGLLPFLTKFAETGRIE
jgi:hypothetical protein